MMFRDEGSNISGGLGSVMKRPRNGCQRKENIAAGDTVKGDSAKEWLEFSCLTHSAQSQGSLPLNEWHSRKMAFPKYSLQFRNGPNRSNKANPCPLLAVTLHGFCAVLNFPLLKHLNLEVD